MPALIVSLTIVAFGTSAPELLIAIKALDDNAPGIALGNVVGSNIFNVGIILALAAPIALGAMCGFMNERSGIVNIGIEGMMISAAFSGWFVASAIVQAFPDQPQADFFFGATPALLIGVVAGTYSSIFVASAMLLRLGVKRDWSKPDAKAGTQFSNIDA